jgi:phosphatidylserine decarboxylase
MKGGMNLEHLFFDSVVRPLPKKWLSHYTGALAGLRLPQSLNQRLIGAFARHYKINVEEAEKPVADYQSLAEFFARGLRQGARPIEGDLVHPCDGVLIESGRLHDESLIQAKGKSFTLGEFIPNNPWVEDFRAGSFFTYYLAPHNYHRVHTPLTAEVKWSTLIPGELWPVNSWSVKNIDGLYARNERVATGLQSSTGKVILVMVGATNVGSMSFRYDPNIQTNLMGKKEVVFRQYPEPRPLQVGEELGTFHLGSTVVLLFEKKWELDHQPRHPTRVGERFNKS